MAAQQALTALKEDRIADFAAAMHPDALKQLKSTLLAVLDAAEKEDRGDVVLGIFKDAGSAEELRKLDDIAFFTAFFEGVMGLQPRMRDAFRDMKIETIGQVQEGPDVVHVVYRGTVMQDDVAVSKMSVMSLKSTPSGWGMLLSGDMEAMASMLKRQFEPAK